LSLSEVHIRHVSPRSPPVLIMEIQLLPAVSLLPETLSVLVAPEEMLARALNGNLHLQQFRILLIAGIRSGILGRLDRARSS